MTDRYSGPERRATKPAEPERWHLSKSVQISHIVATVLALGAAVMYVTDMRRDMMVKDAQLESKIDAISSRQSDDRTIAAQQRGELLAKFNSIDAKLDLLMQRQPISTSGRR